MSEATYISTRETLALVGRAFGYAWPLRYQLLVKLGLSMLAVYWFVFSV